MIAVSEDNYLALKRLGNAGDSFNDVVTEVLRRVSGKNEREVAV
jgi:predicted CopG family antitoxin